MTVWVWVGDELLYEAVVTEGNEISVVVENLYPTATFEVKVIALSSSKDYGTGGVWTVMDSG